MNPGSAGTPTISVRLRNITDELRDIQQLLTSGAELDPSILCDFRDAVNRVRTTAWAMQQYSESKAAERDPKTVLSILAGERVRVAYQLCRLVQGDLANPQIHFQKGQLSRLHDAAEELARRLKGLIGD